MNFPLASYLDLVFFEEEQDDTTSRVVTHACSFSGGVSGYAVRSAGLG